MDSQRRFEGPDLQALLIQVQQECGPDATILEANKLRSGGIGGFFSRERFEVIVDAPGVVAQESSTPDTNALQATLQGGGTKAGPRRITTTPTVWNPPTAQQAASPTSHLENAVVAAMEAADATPSESAATSILELAEQRNAQEHAVAETQAATEAAHGATETHAAPSVSTEGPAFAEVLGRLAREALNQQSAPTDFVPLVPPVIETAVAEPPMQERVAAAAAPVAAPATAPVAAPAATAPLPATRSETAPARVTPQSPVAAALSCLGVPDHLVPATHALSELRNDLIASLRWLPGADPLPTGNGSVIAVVGNAEHAMTMAQQLAAELGCDEREIVVAGELADEGIPSWLRLQDLADAGERRKSWRRRTAPTVVAVAAPLGYDPAVWARPMLDVLEPTIAWGVVSADRKAEDVRAWIDRLGGVDALALTDTDLTVSPATMLQLGIPIARLDGDRADPVRWANLLLGRLAA